MKLRSLFQAAIRQLQLDPERGRVSLRLYYLYKRVLLSQPLPDQYQIGDPYCILASKALARYILDSYNFR